MSPIKKYYVLQLNFDSIVFKIWQLWRPLISPRELHVPVLAIKKVSEKIEDL